MTKVLLLFLFVLGALSIKFEIVANVERCFKEEFKPDTLIKGTVEVTPLYGDQRLDFKITDNQGAILTDKRDVSKTNYALTSQAHEGEYSFCFKDNAPSSDRKRWVIWNIEEQKEKDYSNIAKKDSLKPIEVELVKMEDKLNVLMEDLNKMRRREIVHRNTNESTNSRVAWMTGASIFVLAALGGAQMYYLKTYFKSKKLI
eukprot:TRINITY_DN6332_c0_g1_i1.p1 TRINITY_DN6332_c0_g1~~TRINITY_DN6332_c0_g1_i1.p1  ORF type:complete len:224 (+),score=64.39 TRINITY_DN6332_c0_g1_i1:71-673(+)